MIQVKAYLHHCTERHTCKLVLAKCDVLNQKEVIFMNRGGVLCVVQHLDLFGQAKDLKYFDSPPSEIKQILMLQVGFIFVRLCS